MTAPSSTIARSYHSCFSIFGKAGDVVVCLKVGFPVLPNIEKKLDDRRDTKLGISISGQHRAKKPGHLRVGNTSPESVGEITAQMKSDMLTSSLSIQLFIVYSFKRVVSLVNV